MDNHSPPNKFVMSINMPNFISGIHLVNPPLYSLTSSLSCSIWIDTLDAGAKFGSRDPYSLGSKMSNEHNFTIIRMTGFYILYLEIQVCIRYWGILTEISLCPQVTFIVQSLATNSKHFCYICLGKSFG